MSKPNENLTEEQQATASETGSETGDSALEKLQSDMERFKDLALRSEADLQNFRKRAAREKEDAIKYSNAAFLERLLPILDNFDMGLAAARNDKNSAIVSGFDMVAKQFQDFLAETGVQSIDAEGQKFDPNLHEALAQEASAKVPEGHVIRQMRKGYKLKDRLLRPANVIVSKGKQ